MFKDTFNKVKDVNDDPVGSVPELQVDDVEDNEAPKKETHISILEKKLVEIEEMFIEQNTKLNEITSEKRELNKREETVKFELSGLHGAKVVLEQLIEEAQNS